MTASPGLVLAAMLAALAMGGRPTFGPVYAVAQVRADLARDPGSWLDRTLRVRGIAALCLASDSHRYGPFCGQGSTLLLDASGVNAILPLALQRQDRLLALLRNVPPLSRFVTAAQTPLWGLPTIYRVELRTAQSGLCSAPPCYEALMLDAVP